ncbi:MAG: hypothetical protein KC766_41990, partial [Myxococcales bacterium]|nr:hypothetical protein [Myxococcales bacterium]
SGGGTGTGGAAGSGGTAEEPPIDCEANLGLAEGTVEQTSFSHVDHANYSFGIGNAAYAIDSRLDAGQVWAWSSAIETPGTALVQTSEALYCATSSWPGYSQTIPRAVLVLSDFSRLGSCDIQAGTPDTLELCYARSKYYDGDGCTAEGEVKLWGSVDGQAVDETYGTVGTLLGDGAPDGLAVPTNELLAARIAGEWQVFCVGEITDHPEVIGGERTTFKVKKLGTCGANPVSGELAACILPQ